MARPTNNGIEYFSFNVDFFDDTKLLFVSSKHEEIGELVTVKLLCWIYKTDGYYTEWNDEISVLFAKKSFSSIKFDKVNDIVNELIKRKFFNEHLFKKYGILTSTGIQKRWIEATKRRKVDIIDKYDLINYCNKLSTETSTNDTLTPTNDTETSINDTLTPTNDTETRQSKVKYSKVKYSKEEEEKFKAIDFKEKILDIDVLYLDYLKNDRVINAVVKNKKNKFKNRKHLEKRLLEFCNLQKEKGVLSKTMEDFSSHFRYWHLRVGEQTEAVNKSTLKIPIG